MYRLNATGVAMDYMNSFAIDKNVPMPAPKRGRRSKYPFAQMRVGDSFSFDLKLRNTVSAAASAYASNNGVKFAMRSEGGNARIWRVA